MILFSLIDLIILRRGDLKIAIDVNNSWKILFHHFFVVVFFHFLCVRKSENVKATCLD